jgi:F0F1-type ATP synthase assembly protein I
MKALPVDNNTVKNIWKMMQIAGLAVSLPFELLAGPFIGYLIGSYLKNSFGIHPYVVHLFIFMGIIASIFNAAIIIRSMVKINKGS